MSKQIQRGFTLIELIVVIVILGILAAFAVPRFMGLENEARASAVASMLGTLRSTSAMAHGMCMAQSCTNSVAVPGGAAIGIAFTYPTSGTLERGIESLQGFTMSTPNAGSRRFTKTGARTANCWVQYNQAANANTPPTFQYSGGVLGNLAGQVSEANLQRDLRAAC